MRLTTALAALSLCAEAGTAGQLSAAGQPPAPEHNSLNDHRAWQHGIDWIRVGARHLLIWSSWGNPPEPRMTPGDHWQHDVYYAWVDPGNPRVDPNTLVSAPEAQEPASTAVNGTGRILMTCEDGDGDINQNAALFEPDLQPIRPYPVRIRDGGHSGHVAALGERFLVVYSEGWIDGGGVDNLGTGDDIWARIVENDGTMDPEIPVSVDPRPEFRDWWPLVAASDRNWLVVWQRLDHGLLMAALVGPDGSVAQAFPIADGIVFYHYAVRYLPSLRLFLVVAERQDGGFAALVDPAGRVVYTRGGLPPIVRESKIVVGAGRRTVTVVYPIDPSGAAALRVRADGIDLAREMPGDYLWDHTGTDGLFVGKHRVVFATLSSAGVRFIPFDGIE